MYKHLTTVPLDLKLLVHAPNPDIKFFKMFEIFTSYVQTFHTDFD